MSDDPQHSNQANDNPSEGTQEIPSILFMRKDGTPLQMYPAVGPGTLTLHVRSMQEDDPNLYVEFNGERKLRGQKLSKLREQFQGFDEFEITDPYLGNKHLVSLKPWASADPEKTYILIGWRFVPDQKMTIHEMRERVKKFYSQDP